MTLPIDTAQILNMASTSKCTFWRLVLSDVRRDLQEAQEAVGLNTPFGARRFLTLTEGVIIGYAT